MTLRMILVAFLAATLAFGDVRADDTAVAEPPGARGNFYVAVLLGPAPGAASVEAEAGEWRYDPSAFKGVAVELGTELTQKLGKQLVIQAYSSSEYLLEMHGTGEWHIAMIPVDEATEKEAARYDLHASCINNRSNQVGRDAPLSIASSIASEPFFASLLYPGCLQFSTAYAVLEATYLVGSDSRIKSLTDVDKPGVRVAVMDGTAVARAAARSLKEATVEAMEQGPSVTADKRLVIVPIADELLASLKSGEIDAIALPREEAAALSARLPGSRVLDGTFWKSYFAIATRSGWVSEVSAFVDQAIASGSVRRALEKYGMTTVTVPPAGTHAVSSP